MDTLVRLELPLPLDVVSTLTRAVGSVYPNATMSTSSGRQLEFRISEEDRRDPAGDPAEVVYAPTDDELEQTLTSVRDGSIGVSPPEWFCKLVLGGAIEVMAEHPEAVNYLEMPLSTPDGGTYVVIVTRPEGRTPHQLRRDAESRAERLAARLRELGVDPDSV